MERIKDLSPLPLIKVYRVVSVIMEMQAILTALVMEVIAEVAAMSNKLQLSGHQ
jgi:hypothetical protein